MTKRREEIDLLLSIVGREALREKTPNLQELDQIIRSFLEQVNPEEGEGIGQDANDSKLKEEDSPECRMPFPIIRMLLQGGI